MWKIVTSRWFGVTLVGLNLLVGNYIVAIFLGGMLAYTWDSHE